MSSLAWRGTKFARPSRVATPNSRAGAHAKEPQKVTPCKNYLAETRPFTGIFARPGVSPCEAIPDPSRGHRPSQDFVAQSRATQESEKCN